MLSLCGGTLSHRFSFEVDLVRAVHQSIQNGVGERRVADIVVPVLDRKLTGDQRRARADPVIEEFEQISAFACAHGRDREVVDDQQAGLGDGGQPFGKAAVGVTQIQFLEQPGRTHVQRRESLTARLVGQRARQEGLAAPGGAVNQKIVC